MRLSFAAVASSAVLVLAACGEEPAPPTDFSNTNTTVVTPSTPLGTVWGMVLDASDQMPLEGASVILSIGQEAKTTTTDAEGMFFFVDVPAGGQAGVSISKDGYTRASLRTQIPGETGDFPAGDIGAFVGPISLFELGGQVEIQLVGYDGFAIGGAAGQVSVRSAYLGEEGWPMGIVTTTATSQDGRLVFNGLPRLTDLATYNMRLTFAIEPVDVDGDGLIDYVGTVDERDASWLLTHGGRYVLELGPAGESSPLQAIASNIASLTNGGVPRPGDSVISVSEPLRIVFNQPVNPDTLLATLWEEDGETAVPATARVENGNVVLVAPSGSPLAGGSEYHAIVEVLARGTTSGETKSVLSGPFFTNRSDAPPTIVSYELFDRNANGALDAGDVVEFELDQVVGQGYGATGSSVRFPVFFRLDLNMSQSFGDARGEHGGDQPIWAEADEVVPVQAGLRPSGFTRNYRFTMPYVPAEGGAPAYAYSINTSLPMVLDFGSSVPGYDRLVDPTGRPVATPGQDETLTVAFPPAPAP